MKTILYTILIGSFILLNACKSVERMVEEGRYDEAIVLATKKLAGKKNKKTKHIIALEKAFAKINDRDMTHIAFLRGKNDPSEWERVYNYALKIQDRQETVLPFLPIVSKNGYKGHFDLIDVNPILLEAKWDKSFEELDYRHLSKAHFNEYNNWTQFHTKLTDDVAYDAISTLYIDNIDISPEREHVNTFVETKEREIWVDAIDANGNTAKDSLGQTIQVKQIEKLNAFITEYIRTKEARISGRVETIAYITGDLISREEFIHDIDFSSDACTYQGDRAALTSKVRKRIDHTLLPFPSDLDMIEEGLNKMQVNFHYHLGKIELADIYNHSIVTAH